MPNARIVKLSKELNIPQIKLEEYWSKAKKIALNKLPKKDPNFWPYVQGIFGNMLHVSESIPVSESAKKPTKRGKTKLASSGLPLWWVKKSTKQKRAYLEKNPGSKFALHFKKEEARIAKRDAKRAAKQAGTGSPNVRLPATEEDQPTPEATPSEPTPEQQPATEEPSQADEWEDETPTPEEVGTEPTEEEPAQEEAAPEETTPEEEPTPPEAIRAPGFWKTTFKVINHVLKKQKHKVVMELKKQKQGVKSLKNLLIGKPVSEADREKAKHAAKVAGVLMLGALAGVAMFTPLGPLAATIGVQWYHDLMEKSGKAESTSSDIDFDSPTNVEAEHWAFENESDDDNLLPEDAEEDDGHSEADFIVDQMTEWLAHQDIPQLVAKLKAQQESEKHQPFTKDGEGK